MANEILLVNNLPLVLVTGATGAVGPSVIEALHQAGHSIRTLSIDEPQAGSLPPGIEARIGDVTDELGVQSAMQGVEAVVHLAALLHITNPPPTLRQRYKKVNIGGTSTVVKAALEIRSGEDEKLGRYENERRYKDDAN